jgi:hypothetical protein
METSILFKQLNDILRIYEKATEEQKELINKQILELTKLYDFLRTLRTKLEMWDCRYDIDKEINFKEKSDEKSKN